MGGTQVTMPLPIPVLAVGQIGVIMAPGEGGIGGTQVTIPYQITNYEKQIAK